MASNDTLYPCLYHLESSQSLRILWALEQLNEVQGLQYRLKICPRSYKGGATKEVHPLGKAPVLCIGPKPEQALTESRLILQYLADTYSKGIWEPASKEDKERDVFFQEFATASLHSRVSLRLMFEIPKIAYPFGLRHLAWLVNWPFSNHMGNDLHLFYQYMEDALSEEKPWFAGESLGLSDFCMSFGMDMASQHGFFDGKGYPKLQAWLERIHSLPAYKRALEKGGKYNLKSFS